MCFPANREPHVSNVDFGVLSQQIFEMLADSVPPETVAKYTGLSAEEIAAL